MDVVPGKALLGEVLFGEDAVLQERRLVSSLRGQFTHDERLYLLLAPYTQGHRDSNHHDHK